MDLPAPQVDLATMTGNVAQVFLTDHDWLTTISAIRGALRPGGRLVFSAFHPALAAAGVEANFEMAGVEYRLGAETHTMEAFCEAIRDAGFAQLRVAEFSGDEAMVAAVPKSRKYLGRPLLLLLTAKRSL